MPPALRVLAASVGLALAAPSAALATTGGLPATSEHPHVAAMLIDDGFSCGGSLVAPDVVLTAGHCVEDYDTERQDLLAPGRVEFMTGEKRLSDQSAANTVAAVEIRRHPGYDGDTLANDVALVRLAANAPGATPIALAQPADVAAGKEAVVAGWGLGGLPPSLEHLGAANELNEVTVHLVADRTCEDWMGADADHSLCAGEPYGVKDACWGDSGGPLTVSGSTGAPVLAGAVSWGVLCGVPTQYGVYARLDRGSVRDWVDGTLPGLTTATSTATADGGTTAAASGTTTGVATTGQDSAKTRKPSRAKKQSSRKGCAKGRAAARKRSADRCRGKARAGRKAARRKGAKRSKSAR